MERGGQFFAGNNLTWADLHVFNFVDRMTVDNTEVSRDIRSGRIFSLSFFQLLEDMPHIKNLVERIEAEPNIAKWLKSRPQAIVTGNW